MNDALHLIHPYRIVQKKMNDVQSRITWNNKYKMNVIL